MNEHMASAATGLAHTSDFNFIIVIIAAIIVVLAAVIMIIALRKAFNKNNRTGRHGR